MVAQNVMAIKMREKNESKDILELELTDMRMDAEEPWMMFE